MTHLTLKIPRNTTTLTIKFVDDESSGMNCDDDRLDQLTARIAKRKIEDEEDRQYKMRIKRKADEFIAKIDDIVPEAGERRETTIMSTDEDDSKHHPHMTHIGNEWDEVALAKQAEQREPRMSDHLTPPTAARDQADIPTGSIEWADNLDKVVQHLEDNDLLDEDGELKNDHDSQFHNPRPPTFRERHGRDIGQDHGTVTKRHSYLDKDGKSSIRSGLGT